MPSPEPIADLHCHPSIKPFGQAYNLNNYNSEDPLALNSIWYYDPPNERDKRLNSRIGLTRFSQSNFSALHKGNVRIAFCALNPIERGFFRSGIARLIPKKLFDIVTGIGLDKIRFIRHMDNYWDEFIHEYKFYEQLHDHPVDVNGKKYSYKLTNNKDDIRKNLLDADTISAVLTVEGAYVFNESISKPLNQAQILTNIDKLKKLPHVPFFLTLCHHFDNRLAGHARSFHFPVRQVCWQRKGLHKGMTEFCKTVIDNLLDNTKGKRIYIDVKHMSIQTRKEYYEYLEHKYPSPDVIPIIVSHGALNGHRNINDYPHRGKRKPLFFNGDANFSDDEILKIEESNGIFGVQADDRLISSRKLRRKAKKRYLSEDQKLKLRAGLIWNNIEHIARVLDDNDRDAWNTAALGTDYDGIVDPPDGYWTSSELPILYDQLKLITSDYMRGMRKTYQPKNQIPSDEIVRNFFFENTRRFLERFY